MIIAVYFQQTDYCFSLFVFFLPPDFQQQIPDHHPDAADRVCAPQNACLNAAS